MTAALENFKSMEGSNKILFLGDMFELGEAAKEEHQKIADFAAELHFENVILIGENFSKTSCNFPKFNSFTTLEENLVAMNLKNNTILIKGSRGMALERILKLL